MKQPSSIFWSFIFSLCLFFHIKGLKVMESHLLRQTPLLSQGIALTYLLQGDKKKANEVMSEYSTRVSETINCIPLLGHVKGFVHYLFNDSKGGDLAMIASTKASLITAGVIAGVSSGPIGFAAGSAIGILLSRLVSQSDVDGTENTQNFSHEEDFKTDNTEQARLMNTNGVDTEESVLQSPQLSTSQSFTSGEINSLQAPKRKKRTKNTIPSSSGLNGYIIVAFGISTVISTFSLITMYALTRQTLKVVQEKQSTRDSNSNPNSSKMIRNFLQTIASTVVGAAYDRVF